MSDNKEQGFLNDYSSNKKLNEAVIEQMGGFESFSENAQDISNHGIDGGFSGFINYSETVEFSQNNRDVILQSLKDDAQEFGSESVPEMMSHWKALDGYSQDEIAEALYSNDDSLDAHTPVYNALAWYAGEKASQEYANAMDSLDREFAPETTFHEMNDLINSGHEISQDKIEFLKNLDEYMDKNELSYGDITIGDKSIDYGEITIEITNMKKIDGEYQDDVKIEIDNKGILVSGSEETFTKVGDANADFSEIKNALDKELRDEVSVSILHSDNQLTKVSVYEMDNQIDFFLKGDAQEKAIDINGERVAWKSGNDVVVDFSGDAGSTKEKLAEAIEVKGSDSNFNVISLSEASDFSSKIDNLQNGKDKENIKQIDNDLEM